MVQSVKPGLRVSQEGLNRYIGCGLWVGLSDAVGPLLSQILIRRDTVRLTDLDPWHT